MDHIPPISVILPVYNGEKFIVEAVDSLLEQTFNDFELIVIDDGSVDGTGKILDTYHDRRIVRVVNSENKGLIYTLNRGIAIAKGKYLARMDADDVCLPERLERQVNFLEAHPEIGVLGTQIRFLDETLKQIVWEMDYPTTHGKIAWQMVFVCSLPHPSIMARRSIFEQHGGYDEDYMIAEDYQLWTRLMDIVQYANLPDQLVLYRRHAGAASDRMVQIQRANSYRTRQEYIQKFLGSTPRRELLEQIDGIGEYSDGLPREQIKDCTDFLIQIYLAFEKSGLITDEERPWIYADMLERIARLRFASVQVPVIQEVVVEVPVIKEITLVREPTSAELYLKLIEMLPPVIVKTAHMMKKYHLIPRKFLERLQ